MFCLKRLGTGMARIDGLGSGRIEQVVLSSMLQLNSRALYCIKAIISKSV